jgi:hypothetical protein
MGCQIAMWRVPHDKPGHNLAAGWEGAAATVEGNSLAAAAAAAAAAAVVAAITLSIQFT